MRSWIRGPLVALRVAGGRFLEDHGFLLASAISFAFLLCLAPLVLILFSIAGFVMASEDIAEYLYDSAALMFPAYGSEFAQFLSVLTTERKVTGLVGGAGLAVFATQLFSLMRVVVNRAFRVRVGRGWVRGFLFDFVAVIVVGLLVVAFAVVIVTVATLGDLALTLLPVSISSSLHLRRAFSLPAIYATGVALLFFVYRTFPNTAVSTRAAATATAAVIALWEVVRWGFGAYVDLFGVYGKLYGSFGIGVAALVWVYYSALIFVFGAELAGVVSEGAPGGGPPPTPET